MWRRAIPRRRPATPDVPSAAPSGAPATPAPRRSRRASGRRAIPRAGPRPGRATPRARHRLPGEPTRSRATAVYAPSRPRVSLLARSRRPGVNRTRSHLSAIPVAQRFEQPPAELLAEGPQPLPGLLVVGLWVRAALAGPIEVAARDPLKLRGGGQAHGRLRPLLDGAHRASEGLEDHPGVHQGGGVQGVDGDATVPETLRELEGEHHLGQLALRVCAHGIVATLQHHIVEVYRALSGRGDVDHPGRGGVAKQGQKQTREQEVRQVVNGEGQFVAVLALPALSRYDARVVDEHVEAVLLREDLLRQGAHLAEGGEVGEIGTQHLAARLPPYLLECGLQTLSVSAVQQHGSAGSGEIEGDAPAQAVRGARHQDLRFSQIIHPRAPFDPPRPNLSPNHNATASPKPIDPEKNPGPVPNPKADKPPTGGRRRADKRSPPGRSVLTSGGVSRSVLTSRPEGGMLS